MSKFVTSIPVDVESVRKLLPAKAFFIGLKFNAESSAVELSWEDDNLVTPYTDAIEFPVEALKNRQLPKLVRLRKDVVAERAAAENKRKAETAAREARNRKLAEERSAARKKVAIKNAQEDAARSAAGATAEQTNRDNATPEGAESKSCTTKTDAKRKSGTLSSGKTAALETSSPES